MALTEISGTLSGTVIEDSTFDADGIALISGQGDTVGVFDSGEFAGMYGALTVAASGAWHYTLTNDLTTVQSLAGNTEAHDYFGISWGYGLAQNLIDIVVRGANDPAIIGGDLTENLNVISAASVSGQIEIFDLDIGEKAFPPVTQTGKFGTLTLNNNGAWQYDLLPGQQTAIQDESKNGVDTFVVSSVDGTVASVTILVSSSAETTTGGAGNDTLTGGAGNDSLDGGTGLDIASYSGNRANFTVTQSGTGFIVTDNTGANGMDTLTNIERLAFADARIALDINGVAGQSYRIYQAAFNRTPDTAGLTFWVSSMDAGVSLTQVASGFIQSAEFQAMYGANPTNANFVSTLYFNVLHRAPDAVGQAFWTDGLNSNATTREAVLAGFSESAENYANVIGTIQNGIILDLI